MCRPRIFGLPSLHVLLEGYVDPRIFGSVLRVSFYYQLSGTLLFVSILVWNWSRPGQYILLSVGTPEDRACIQRLAVVNDSANTINFMSILGSV